jgi:hypothetical protein
MNLIKHFNGFKVEVLNEVVAVGRLVYVKNEKNLTELSSKDIAIFEHIPEECRHWQVLLRSNPKHLFRM